MDEEPRVFSSAGATCETCKRPDLSNMTWDDGIKSFFTTFLATPRMWPIGYILDSPYSPLRLERHITTTNWRDAFEDLLALEAGGSMISEESREAENRYAARNRFEIASRSISASNLILQENHKFENQYRKLQKIAMKQENNRIVDIINENLLPFIKSHNESHVATARQTTAHYESHKNSTASSLKPRGQWIASLVDSGALPTWNWQVRNSKDGPVMGFNKRNAPPELHASIMISELELRKIFNEGQPHNFGSPDPLPPTAVKALVDPTYTPSYVELPVDVFKKFRPGKASIMAQSADTEVLKMPDGSTCAKVKITNSLADGTTETKEFVQKPAELLEEIENARKSMQMMLLGLANMSQGGPDPLRQAIEDITGELERLEGQSLDSPDS